MQLYTVWALALNENERSASWFSCFTLGKYPPIACEKEAEWTPRTALNVVGIEPW